MSGGLNTSDFLKKIDDRGRRIGDPEEERRCFSCGKTFKVVYTSPENLCLECRKKYK